MSDALAIDGGKPVRTNPLPRPYPGASMIGEEEKRAVMEVLDHRSPFRYYGPDPAYKTAELEKVFAEAMGVKYALAVTSGTAALIVAMRALGIGPGDEVIVPAATFVGCAGAVASCQAVPIFCEVDEDVHIYPEAIEAGDYAAHEGDFGGALAGDGRGDGPDPGAGRTARDSGHRGLRAVAGGALQGAVYRVNGNDQRVQFPDEQGAVGGERGGW